ncbi:MAG TPA: hypothetical protein VG938_12555 [Verrucomicrobiae bacterium]|jgi:hypothetical protein|nr:hypothetical protein [Verrucomicrobiae bacterium]
MTTQILLIALLLTGWILSLSRKGWAARALVLFSVPLGAFLGGYFGFMTCRLMIFVFDSKPENQHNWIGWIDAGILGAVIGVIFLPGIALAISGRRKP